MHLPPVPPTLEGGLVRLEPMRPEHAAALGAAVTAVDDRTSFAFTWVPRDADEAARYVADALAAREAGHQVPFVQVHRASGAVVGSTRFMALEQWDWPGSNGLPDVAEIGSTWLVPAAQRTGVNVEAKLLLMAHAFEAWRVQRLVWKTDARNERSRRAIEALGARFEGVLRATMPSADDPGRPRDSAFFSMLPEEWPAARERLQRRLRS